MPSKQKIYTRRGDSGETSLINGPRVSKDAGRIVLTGELDELSTVLGLVRTEKPSRDLEAIVLRIQRELLEFGAEIACPDPTRLGLRKIDRQYIQRLEMEIDDIETFLEPLTGFVIPGANKVSALLHLARTVCRRSERSLVGLIRMEPNISQDLLAYLNRLSDLLFVMARKEEVKTV